MNKRLTIICIIFSITYILIIGQNISAIFVPAFVSGFKTGYEQGAEGDSHSSTEFLITEMQPKQGAFTTPTSIVNLKNGKNIDVEVRQMFLKIQDADPLSLQLKILHVVQMILSLTCFVLIIYIPVQSFKVVRSLVKNEIFDMYNIKRIRRIGYALLVTCAFSVFGLYVMAAQANYLVDLENYEFVIGMTDQKLLILIFGLVILAFAEILKMALNMKEENDLTV